jgi:hypothetical protein
MTHKVIDNFLPSDYFESLFNLISGEDFPWFYGGHVADTQDTQDCYFTHNFYRDHRPNSNFFESLKPFLDKLEIQTLLRVRTLLYIGRDKLLEHGKHSDTTFSHKACVLYLNTNDGFTRLNDTTCVNSVKNRALLFDGSQLHNSTNCTSDQRRLVITVNYL